jgi:hypothetical protein
MKVLCCLNADIVSSVALNLLLPALAAHEVHVALSARVGRSGDDQHDPAPRRDLRVAEQRYAQDVLFPLVERAAFADDGRYLTFGELAHRRGIDVTALPNPNSGKGSRSFSASRRTSSSRSGTAPSSSPPLSLFLDSASSICTPVSCRRIAA